MHSLIEMSITGAILIIVIIILRALMINHMPKKAFLILWAAALARLILPFSLPSPISIYRTVEDNLPDGQGYRPLLITQGGIPDTGTSVSPLLVVWLAGMLLLALAFLITHLRSRRTYSASLPVENSFVRNWTASHRLRRPVQTRYSDQIGTPFTYGILWPVVVLPKSIDWTDEESLGYILTHEYSHIRRFDALTKWILAAVLCMHWFNPLVWAMYVLANRDLELSCDEAVLRQYGVTSRSSYALALVSMEEHRSGSTPLSMGFSRQALKERVIAIMSSRPLTLGSILAACAVIVITVALFATTAPAKTTATSQAGEQSSPQMSGQSPLLTEGQPAQPEGSQTRLPDEGQTGTAGGNNELTSGDESPFGGINYNIENEGDLEDDEYYKKDEYEPNYTQEQYDLLIKALTIPDYEDLSIAEFNSRIHAILSKNYEKDNFYYLYDEILSSISEDDPNAAYLINTVQLSLREYDTRLDEVYSGKKVDHEFYGDAAVLHHEDVFGDMITIYDGESSYMFTYRILDQDRLTVRERDDFMQQIALAAQEILESMETLITEEEYMEALTAAGKKLSNDKIEFTGCEIMYFNIYDYD